METKKKTTTTKKKVEEKKVKAVKNKVEERAFELVNGAAIKAKIPARATVASAGYDFVSPYTVHIQPGELHILKTDVKAKMLEDEVLELYVRSSIGIKKQLMLANGTGIIDSDYYNNESNEGNIGIPLYNYGKQIAVIEAGERIAQGVFKKFLTCGDVPMKKRTGGTGSTGKGE